MNQINRTLLQDSLNSPQNLGEDLKEDTNQLIKYSGNHRCICRIVEYIIVAFKNSIRYGNKITLIIFRINENDPENYIVDRLNDFDEDPDHYYIAERPKVYKRGGDTRIYDGTEIDIITGGIYRSLHYTVKYKGYYVEIQGRTLFEEGWGEIEHDIIYPYNKGNEMLNDYSKLLNRLTGLADEMSSYFRKLRDTQQ